MTTTTNLNLRALRELRDWLLDGAPHAILDMTYGIMARDEWDEESYFALDEFEGQEHKTDCGTVCCIAGAADLMERSRRNGRPMQAQGTSQCGDTMLRALTILGLSRQPHMLGLHHELFDPNLAPDCCTPHQAAQAVQNVIDGKVDHPWEGVA